MPWAPPVQAPLHHPPFHQLRAAQRPQRARSRGAALGHPWDHFWQISGTRAATSPIPASAAHMLIPRSRLRTRGFFTSHSSRSSPAEAGRRRWPSSAGWYASGSLVAASPGDPAMHTLGVGRRETAVGGIHTSLPSLSLRTSHCLAFVATNTQALYRTSELVTSFTVFMLL
jgi:hypothetical protein